MSKFIGYTNGYQTSAGFVKAEYNRASGGAVLITAASAHNLSQVDAAGKITISAEEFSNRPQDAYDGLLEATWAFAKLGITVAQE